MSTFSSQIVDFFSSNARTRKRSPNTDETFIDIIKQHPDLWQECFALDCFVCCPVSSSIGSELIPKEQVMAHILVPGRIPGEFISLIGQHVHISSNYLVCGVGFKEARKVKILGVNQLTDSWGKTISTYQLNRPLVGGIMNSPEEADEMTSIMMFKYIAILRSYPELEAAFGSLDEYLREVKVLGKMSGLEGFSKVKPSLSVAIRLQWQKTCDRIGRTGALVSTLGGGNTDAARLQIGQILESYMLHGLAEVVYPWLCRRVDGSSIDSRFRLSSMNAVIESLSWCTQSDLGIAPEFQTPQGEAALELCTLSDALTPVDKMLVLKRTVNLVRNAVDCNASRKFSLQWVNGDLDFATDDLVLLLIWVIIQAYPRYHLLPVDLLYCSEFHFGSLSRSELGYNLCHFEVAVSWFTDRSNNSCVVSPPRITDDSHSDVISDSAIDQHDSQSEKDTVIIDLGDNPTDSGVPHQDSTVVLSEPVLDTPLVKSELIAELERARLPSLSCVDNLRANILWVTSAKRRRNVEESSVCLNSPQLNSVSSILTLFTQRPSRSRTAESKSPLQLFSSDSIQPCAVNGLFACAWEDYYCALSAEGEVFTWGRGDCGRLGRGAACEIDSFQRLAVPRLVSHINSSSRVKQVACGTSHMLAVVDSGEVFVWGDNRCGQLGLFDLSMRALEKGGQGPRTATGTRYSTVEELCLASDLTVVGATSPTVLAVVRPVKMISVACGAYHSLCLAADGQVYSWGRAANGRLGQSSDSVNAAENLVGRPALVRCRWQPASPVSVDEVGLHQPTWSELNNASSSERISDSVHASSKVVFIAAGFSHSIAITECGAVYTWGCGTHGVLGHGSHCDEYLPRQVAALRIPDEPIMSASAAHHSLFLSRSGYLFGCGLNACSQVDCLSESEMSSSSSSSSGRTAFKLDRVSILVPRPIVYVVEVSKFVADRFSHISCGEFHSAAVVLCPEPGRMVVWGDCEHLSSNGTEKDEEGLDLSGVKCEVTHLLPQGEQMKQVVCGKDTVLVVTDKKMG